MPVFLVCLAQRNAQSPQHRVLDIRHVQDNLSTRTHNSEQLLHENGIFLDMLKKIDDSYTVEFIIAEWRSSSVDLIRIRLNQLCNGSHTAFVEIGAGPASTALPQQVTDHAVVAANVEAAQMVDRP